MRNPRIRSIVVAAAVAALAFLAACNLPNTPPAPTQASDPVVTIDRHASPSTVTISTVTPGATIYYTLDGTPPRPGTYSSTATYSGPFVLYKTATVKALARKSGLDDSATVSSALSIVPVSLTIGVAHDFDGLALTLTGIHWYSYRDMWGATVNTSNVILEFRVSNGTGIDLGANPMYSWGVVLESPGGNQLDCLYNSGAFHDNAHSYQGYSVVSGASIMDSAAFAAPSQAAISLTFEGCAPYRRTFSDPAGYYFEVAFAKSDIASVPIS
jgi:hypothetical protein